MVTGNDDDVWVEFKNLRDERIKIFCALFFGFEVTIFPSTVGVLEMDKEEVVFVPVFFYDGCLLVEVAGVADDVHSDESCEAFVHRIDCHCGGAKSIDFFVRW